MDIQVEYLTDELKRMIRNSCKPSLITQYPVARRVLIPDEARLANPRGRSRPGDVARSMLLKRVFYYNGPTRFDGRDYPVELLRECWLRLLGLEHSGSAPDSRREWVIDKLGLDCSAIKWRKEGPEWQFLRMLASSLMPENTASAKRQPSCQN